MEIREREIMMNLKKKDFSKQQNRDVYPPLYSIQHGTVVKIEAFGVFVKLDNFFRHGLIHISQLSNYKTEKIENIVEINDPVWVKVIDIKDPEPDQPQKSFASSFGGDDDETNEFSSFDVAAKPKSTAKKVSLSLRFVSQSDGKDLDQNNSQLAMMQNKTKKAPEEQKKLELGAILNTICTKCNGKGHLEIECYNSKTGVKYDLIESPKHENNTQDKLPQKTSEKSEKKRKKET